MKDLRLDSLGACGSFKHYASLIESQGVVAIDYTAGNLNQVSSAAGESSTIIDFMGSKFIEINLSTVPNQLFQCDFIPASSLFLGGFKTLQFPIWFDDMSSTEILNGIVQVWIYLSDNTQVRVQLSLTRQEPGLFVLSFSRDSLVGGTTAITQLDELEVTKIKILATSGSSSSTKSVIRLGQVYSSTNLAKGQILIYMDGEYRSQYDYLLPLLNANGLKANLAITNKDIGTIGRMSLSEIQKFYEHGHTILNHTFGSASSGWDSALDYPTKQSIIDDLQSQWEFLAANKMHRGIGHCVDGFSTAFISTVSNARQKLVSAALKSAGVKSCRGNSRHLAAAGGVGMTFPSAFRMIPAGNNRIYGGLQITSTTTTTDIINIIDAVIERKETAFIVIHRSVLNANVAGPLEMTNNNMKNWMEYLSKKVTTGEIKCVTVDQI